MSSTISASSSSSSSASDESGILDDLLGNGSCYDANSPKRQSERIRQRRRELFGGKNTTISSTGKKLKLNNNTNDSYDLIGKRIYPPLSLQQPNYVEVQPKTKLEMAVLTDCIYNHFLLTVRSTFLNRNIRSFSVAALGKDEKDCDADSSLLMIETLVNRFKRVNFRKNEIIFEEGDPADYLYILYQGEFIFRSENEGATTTSLHSKYSDDENKNDEDVKEDVNGKYAILGELELLTNFKYYKKTAKATSQSCTLFRLGANDFQSYFLPHNQVVLPALSPSHQTPEVQEQHEEQRLLGLLQNALPAELSTYFSLGNDEDNEHHIQLLKRLLSERKVRNFRKGDILIHKSKPLHALVIITDGLVLASNNTAGGRQYEDLRIGQGEIRSSFGWQSVLKMTNVSNVSNANGNMATASDTEHNPAMERIMTGTIRAETDGQAIVISKQLFENVFSNFCYNHDGDHQHDHRSGQPLLLDVQHLFNLRWNRTQIQQISIFKDSGLDSTQIDGLLDLMHHCGYIKDETIFKAGEKVDAAMYFVREGSVQLEIDKGRDIRIIEKGGYFGEKNMLLDQNTSGNQNHCKYSNTTAISCSASTKVDMLLLEECRKVVNTTILGLGRDATVNAIDDSVKWTDLKRHKLIGTGSYGQVWLASTIKSVETGIDGEGCTNGTKRRTFALKVQAKYPLIQAGAAEQLIAERNILASLNSPFIIRLFNVFQDDYRLYMVTSLLPGGELESILPERGLSENTAKFYAAGVLEALTYMHRKHIIHRDVKTDNILLNDKGYPVLIDMGFAKYVSDKSYTFCGSPMFMAPETILHQGQNKGVDHWSWAVVVYRLVTGIFPFYQNGMDELALYKAICKGSFEVTGTMSIDFRMLMIAILYPDPSKRLGSRVNGWRDIFDAPWFTNDQSSLDLQKLRKQTLPAPWIPSSGTTDASSDSSIHQSSSNFEDFFNNDICGKIPDNQQKIFNSFGPHVSSPIGDPTIY